MVKIHDFHGGTPGIVSLKGFQPAKILVGGFNPSEKYEFASWDYYSQLNGKINVPNHQPEYDGQLGEHI